MKPSFFLFVLIWGLVSNTFAEDPPQRSEDIKESEGVHRITPQELSVGIISHTQEEVIKRLKEIEHQSHQSNPYHLSSAKEIIEGAFDSAQESVTEQDQVEHSVIFDEDLVANKIKELQESSQRLSPPRGWYFHFLAQLSGIIAPRRDPIAQNEIPWRPLEKSSFRPLQLWSGLSYSLSNRYQIDMSVRIAQASLYDSQSEFATLYRFTEPPLAWGELSTTITFESGLKLTLGRFLKFTQPDLALTHATIGQLYHLGTSSELPLWRWEDREWSHHTAPFNRWRFGLSLAWSTHSEKLKTLYMPRFKRFSDGSEIDHLGVESYPQSALRFSLFIPHERFSLLSLNRGILGELLFEQMWRRLTLELKFTLGYSRLTSNKGWEWGRERLGVAQILDEINLEPLSTRMLWLYANTHVQTYQGSLYQAYVYLGAQLRDVDDQALDPLVSAAFSEGLFTGRGVSGWLGAYFSRPIDLHLNHRALPHRFGVTYSYVDPHHEFAYDGRHRLRWSVNYQFELYWGVMTAEAWYTHMWSAAENRSQLGNSMGGFTFEVRR